MTTIIFHNDKNKEVKVRYNPAHAPPQIIPVKPLSMVTFVLKTDLILVKQWDDVTLLQDLKKIVSPKESETT